jgi:hypothetical protein
LLVRDPRGFYRATVVSEKIDLLNVPFVQNEVNQTIVFRIAHPFGTRRGAYPDRVTRALIPKSAYQSILPKKQPESSETVIVFSVLEHRVFY